MKPPVHSIGIDFGTSSVKVAALGRDGSVVAVESARIAARRSPPPSVRQRPAEWIASLKEGFGRLSAHCDLSKTAAFAVDGTSGTMLAIDTDGSVIGDALMYNDTCGAAHASRIRAVAPEDSAAHGVASALARAAWIWSARHPARLVHQADWIVGCLTGRYGISDESNALKTGYDALARQWPDWIDAISPTLRPRLPEVVAVGERIGTATTALAAELGLPKGAACIAGCTDGCAAFLAAGASEVGDAVTSLGSTLTLKVLSDKPVFMAANGIYSHRLGDLWLPGGASNAGGAAIADALGTDRLAAIEADLDPSADTGLDFYPSLVRGERFPVADPEHAPRMGPRPDDDARYLQGLYESLARIEAAGYARLHEAGAPVARRVLALGGGARSAAFMAIRARVLGVETIPAEHQEAAVGMALLAARKINA